MRSMTQLTFALPEELLAPEDLRHNRLKDADHQAMQWPRRSDSPDDEALAGYGFWGCSGRLKIRGHWIETNQIPDAIKYAQFELALVVLDDDGTYNPGGSATNTSATIKPETLGKWSISYDNTVGSTTIIADFSTAAMQYLQPFLVDTLRVERA